MLTITHRLPGRVRFSLQSEEPGCPSQEPAMRRALDCLLPDYTLRRGRSSGRYLLTYPPQHDIEGALRDKLAELLARGSKLADDALARGGADAGAGSEGDADEPTLTSAAQVIVPRVAKFLLMRAIIPPWLQPLTTAVQVWPFVKEALSDLRQRKLSVAVLDGAAIAASLGMRDFGSASTIAFLLDLGGALEDWTKERARKDLTRLYQTDDGFAWVVRDGAEVRVAVSEIRSGDEVIVRMGARVPIDGTVVEGEAMVNQSVMTGESRPVARRPGLTVYAGSVVEEGALRIRAACVGDETRAARIATLLERSSQTKGEAVNYAEQLSARAVPYTFLASAATYGLTRNFAKAASLLVVDYSCALKMAAPLAIKTAMIEAASAGALIKGGKHAETLARATVFLLDKTGTLTDARPRLLEVYPFNGHARDEVLRNAACLEEHFPHPVATAIVERARQEQLHHEERHGEVEYVVAHGLASSLDGERLVLGSRHFVEEHEGIDVSAGAEVVSEAAARGHSALYFGVGRQLAGVLIVDDPVLPESPQLVARLKQLGMRVIMLTGDGEQSARTVAKQVGIDEVHASMFPDDKAELISRLQAEGHTVVMVGDGVNDSAALAGADVGVSVKHGADIAREACDVLLLDGRLAPLPDAVEISRRAMRRIQRSFYLTLGANSVFLGLGLLANAPTALLALLHNTTTVGTCVWATRPLLRPARGEPPPERE